MKQKFRSKEKKYQICNIQMLCKLRENAIKFNYGYILFILYFITFFNDI